MADNISSEVIANIATTKIRDIDNIYILPNAKSVTIRTLWIYKNATGDIVNTKQAPDIVFVDSPYSDGNGEPIAAVTDFTDFFVELGLSKSKIRTAIKNRLQT